MTTFKTFNWISIAICILGIIVQVGGDYYKQGWADYGIYIVILGLGISSANQYLEDKKKKNVD